MKIEKLNENQILFILSQEDLASNKISVHSFMANSQETKELLLHILKIAETDFNFFIGDSSISVEAMNIANNNFIFTITKYAECDNICNKNTVDSQILAFKFDSLDNFSDFISYSQKYFSNVFENINLYYYQNSYFLLLNTINFSDKFLLLLSEFANKANPSIISRISEFGSCLI